MKQLLFFGLIVAFLLSACAGIQLQDEDLYQQMREGQAKISEYAALAEAPAVDDLLVIVDVSDTSMAASGTTKKITTGNLMGAETDPKTGAVDGVVCADGAGNIAACSSLTDDWSISADCSTITAGCCLEPDGVLYCYDADGAVVDVASASIFEASLGNPDVDGKILSSTAAGVRSWVALSDDIIPNPTGFDDHAFYGRRQYGVAGEALSRGDVVYLKLNSGAWKWYKYDADGTYKTILPMGIATADISSAATGVILTDGVMRDDTWNLSPSADTAVTVYASTTAGGVTLTPPGAASDHVVVVGFLSAANTINLRFGFMWVVDSGS